MNGIKTLFVLWLFFLITTAQAQSVISFTGGMLSNSSMTISFSAGEVVSGAFSGTTMSVFGGFSNGSDVVPVSNENLTDGLPTIFRLNQNYPNPFNPSTNISFDLPIASNVSLEVYNAIGAKVAVLAEGRKPAGSHLMRFNASWLSSGMYFYRLTADGKIISTKKMLLIK